MNALNARFVGVVDGDLVFWNVVGSRNDQV